METIEAVVYHAPGDIRVEQPLFPRPGECEQRAEANGGGGSALQGPGPGEAANVHTQLHRVEKDQQKEELENAKLNIKVSSD